ncbi:MAG: SLBB domain-containing protein [Ignavibacteriae bacterium]|nr:SLBB domain-containing protein [Ignavibacteriota bacterium]
MIVVIAGLFTLAFSEQTFGQSSQSGLAPVLPTASAASYYYIAKPGELTMQVNIWGFVQKPGRYEVSSSTDLVQLISFAGGPLQYADLSDVKLTRVYRGDSTSQPETFIINLEQLEDLSPTDLVLYPGDTIHIEHSAWISFRDAFGAFTTLALITTAIAQLINATR